LLSKSDWAVLTAENPMGEQASAEANAAAMTKLKADLDAIGATYKEVRGKYGNEENSLAVTGISEKDAVALGKKYDQDSVLTNKGDVATRSPAPSPSPLPRSPVRRASE
jgi:hypothetical protein